MTIIAFFITPFLPAFAVWRDGPIDNNNRTGKEFRLPLWLSWFDTPDNSLFGDNNWNMTHDGGYLSQVAWLYRNSLYGFKWGFLSAPVDQPITYVGDPSINRNNGKCGVFKAQMGKYWEYKIVKKIYGNRGIMFDFGWLLNAYVSDPHLVKTQPKALFQFSPRIVTIK